MFQIHIILDSLKLLSIYNGRCGDEVAPPFPTVLGSKKKNSKEKGLHAQDSSPKQNCDKRKRKQCDKVGGLQVQKMSTMRKLGGGLGA